METVEPVRYHPGDLVSVRVGNPATHYRTPSYIQGKKGRVDSFWGVYRNPESLAYGGSGAPKQPLYRVEFNQGDLWENYNGQPADKLLIDIYQHWLDPADSPAG